jgi:predicted ribosomally synthesized peptide with nif11-like leader
MSREQAEACIVLMKTDENFRNQILSIGSEASRMQAINEAGFSCTLEEIRQASQDMERCDDVTGGLEPPECWIDTYQALYCTEY